MVGAGGAGRETLDVALAAGQAVTAFLDERTGGTTARGLRVWPLRDAVRGSAYVIGIADGGVRQRLSAVLDAAGLVPWTLVHPLAVVGPETRIGAGCVVMALAHVSSDVRLSSHVHVQYGATVGHDAVLEDHATVLPGASVSGSVVVGCGATVGSRAVVLQGRTVGRGAYVGAGAVVTRDVPDGVVVVGSPARPLRRHDQA